MIRTLAWKEYREQRPVWLALAVLGIVLLVGLWVILGPPGSGSPNRMDNALGGIAVVVAFTYGLVCGAMMLAGERETKTLPFLDYLEGKRARLWNTKVVTGVVLTLTLAMLLAGVATALGAGQRKYIPGSLFAIAAASGLAGLACGLLGSALCQNVLAAVGVGAVLFLWLGAPFAVAIGSAPVLIFDMEVQNGNFMPLVFGELTVTTATLAASGLIFCFPDRQRRRSPSRRATLFLDIGEFSGIRAIVWLTYRQSWVGMLVLAAAALMLGAIVPENGLLLWPLVTLLLGVGCGMAVFANEQAGDGHRFLGDQRLPVGRIWAVKTICWFGMAAVLAALTFATATVQISAKKDAQIAGATGVVARLAGQEMLVHIGRNTFLMLGLVYGFAFGQFFTLVARKNAVAMVLAVLIGVAVAALWVPSMVSGGVRLWQVMVVPGLLLASIWPVSWAWAAGRLHTLKPMLFLTGIGILAAAWIAGNFWYRVVSIPDVGEPFDVRAFAASLPTPEQNETGRLIRRAAESLEHYEKEVSAKLKLPSPQVQDQPRAPDDAALGPPTEPPPSYMEQNQDVMEKGWPKDRPDLRRWLDRMFEGEWAADYRKAAQLPLGMVMDLRTATLGTEIDYVQKCRQTADLFTARALQLQAQGNPQAALEHLGVVLSLSRQLRHKAPSLPYLVGIAVQRTALFGFASWVRELGPRPAHLRAALTVLNGHEAQLPPFADYVKANYLLVQNGRDNLPLIPAYFFPGQGSQELFLFAVASKVPWEEERETRLLRILPLNALGEAERPLWEEPPCSPLPAVHWNDEDLPIYAIWSSNALRFWRLREAERRSLCDLRGTRLQIGLACYELDNGRPAATLDALVPRYLPALPLDPYSGQSFHYRVSKGEQIEKVGEPVQTFLKVQADQGILWSVGPDRKDNGGKKDGSGVVDVWPDHDLDWIFLVPRWQEPEP